MAAIAFCPKCAKQVAVPDHADHEAEVRCPLCSAEFKLSDTVTSEIPQLVLIGGSAASMPGHTMGDGDIPDGGDELSLPLDHGAALADDQHEAKLAGLHDHGDAGSPEDAGEIDFGFLHGGAGLKAPAAGAIAGAEHPTEGPILDVGEHFAMAPHDGDDALATEDAHPFGTGEHDSGIGGFDAAGDSGSAAMLETKPIAARRERRKPGLFGQMVGVVLFGIIGIAMGYGVLKWLKPAAVQPIDEALHDSWIKVSSTLGLKSSVANNEPGPAPGDRGEGRPAPHNPGGPTDSGLGSDNGGPVTLPPLKQPEPQNNAPAAGTSAPATTGSASRPGLPPHPPGSVVAPGTPLSLPELSVEVGRAEELLSAARGAMDQSSGAVSREVYFAACDLGNALALLDNPTGNEARQARQSAAELLRSLAEPPNRETLGFYAEQWLFSGKRPADRSGVLLVGRVEKIVPLSTRIGNVFATQLTIQGKTEQKGIRVLSSERPEFHVHDTAGVLGTIVTEPSRRLPWYTGQEPQVVLSGVALKLGREK